MLKRSTISSRSTPTACRNCDHVSRCQGTRPRRAIADKIAAEQNLTKALAKAIVESVFKQISDAARSGAETSVPGFGKFKVKDARARGPQSADRRNDQDRSLEEALLHVGEGR
jgi:nucleoid DNA-binding protein